MRISDWSSDVCSSDLAGLTAGRARLSVMVLEVALIDVLPGHEDKFAAAYAQAQAQGILTADEGCRSVRMNRGIETPTRFVLLDRKSVVEGKSVSVGVDLGGRRIIKKKKNNKRN